MWQIPYEAKDLKIQYAHKKKRVRPAVVKEESKVYEEDLNLFNFKMNFVPTVLHHKVHH